jgi:hypothetical protein
VDNERLQQTVPVGPDSIGRRPIEPRWLFYVVATSVRPS